MYQKYIVRKILQNQTLTRGLFQNMYTTSLYQANVFKLRNDKCSNSRFIIFLPRILGSACDFVQITPIFNFLSSPVLCNQHTSLLLAYWLGICHNFWYWDTIGRLFSIDIPRNYLSHFIIFMFYDKVQHPYFSSFQNCFVLLPARSRLY